MSIVRWSALARRDLAASDDRYGPIDPDLAARMAASLIDAAAFLLRNPRAGPAIERRAFRKWNVAGTPYILIYRPDGRDIRIARVLHERRNWRDAP